MAIWNKIFKGNTLYFPGCATKFVAPDVLDKYENILRNVGIDYIKLSDLENCCGSPVLNAGYNQEFLNLAEKNLQVFKDHSVKKIIFNCPACYKIFTKDYKQVLGDKWNIETEHIVITLINLLKDKNLNLRQNKITVTFHDPCHLARQMDIFKEPRELLTKAGVKIKEMKLSGKNSFCCGGGGGLKSNFSQAANEVAKTRIEMAKETGANILITPCPMCFMNMKENSADMKVMELSDIIEIN